MFYKKIKIQRSSKFPKVTQQVKMVVLLIKSSLGLDTQFLRDRTLHTSLFLAYLCQSQSNLQEALSVHRYRVCKESGPTTELGGTVPKTSLTSHTICKLEGFPPKHPQVYNLLKELTEFIEHYTDSHDLLQGKDTGWDEPKEEAHKAGSRRSTTLKAPLVLSPWSQVHMLPALMCDSTHGVGFSLTFLGQHRLIKLYGF